VGVTAPRLENIVSYKFKHKYKIYCGPSAVNHVAEILDRAYLNVTVVGTAHVHIETNFGKDHILRVLGPTWKIADITEIL
jgi:hypothetical protein